MENIFDLQEWRFIYLLWQKNMTKLFCLQMRKSIVGSEKNKAILLALSSMPIPSATSKIF